MYIKTQEPFSFPLNNLPTKINQAWRDYILATTTNYPLTHQGGPMFSPNKISPKVDILVRFSKKILRKIMKHRELLPNSKRLDTNMTSILIFLMDNKSLVYF